MTNPLYDALFGQHHGAQTPFLHLPGGGTLTHDAFLDRADRFAAALAALGVETGDRLAIQVPKSADALALYAACVKAGVVLLPLNTAYTAGELDYFIADSGAALFVCDPADEARLTPVAGAHGVAVATLGASGEGSLAAAADAASPGFEAVDRAGDDLAALLYTSGTTGRSKGAMLTHDNLLSNAAALVEGWRFTASDVLLHALPIFHVHGLFVATNVSLLSGGAMIFLPRFDLDAVLAELPRATAMMGVPTFYTRLLDDPAFTREAAAHMRLFVSGSAPLLAETHARFEARTGHRILERYGMTETSMITSNPYEGERRAGTVGFPLPGVEIRVTEGGREVAPGEIGTVEVRGPNVFKGYWQMPEKTAEEMRDDGFFVTGDLGRVDPDGYLQIVGRAKDLIISGGYNVYPKEVETVLDSLPGVLESAVVGAPHADLGESVVAVLVPEPGAGIDLAAVEAAVSDRLARFKQPRHYALADALPRNTMGKVQKAELRARLKDVFAR